MALDAVYRLLNADLFHVLRIVGPLGELWVVLPLAAVLVAWCLNSSERRGAFAIAATTLGTLAMVVFLKFGAQLIGPRWQPHWEYVSSLFPSGHAAMGTVVYGALAICLARAMPRVGIAFVAVTAIMIVLIGIERVASNSHPWGDVMGGIALGAVGLAALVRLWPAGKPRPLGISAVAAAGVLIVHFFYGREVPSAEILAHASSRLRVAVSAVEHFAIRDWQAATAESDGTQPHLERSTPR
jgi:undecaprenyl-diphosphatase